MRLLSFSFWEAIVSFVLQESPLPFLVCFGEARFWLRGMKKSIGIADVVVAVARLGLRKRTVTTLTMDVVVVLFFVVVVVVVVVVVPVQ